MGHRHRLGTIILAVGSLVALQTASAQTVSLDDVRAEAPAQVRSFFQQHCRDPFAGGTDHHLQFQTGMLDGDDQPDLYADLDPALLQARQCDATNVRLTWLSSRGYVLQADRMPASETEADAQPAAAQTNDAAPPPNADDGAATPADSSSSAPSDRASGPAMEADQDRSQQTTSSNGVSTAQASQTDQTFSPQMKTILAGIVVGVLLVGLLVLWSTGRFLQISTDRYGYRPLLNFSNILYFLIVPMLIVGGIKYQELYPLIAGGLVLWLVRMAINMKNTSVVYGFLLSIVQLLIIPLLVVGGWMLRGLFIMHKQDKLRNGYVG